MTGKRTLAAVASAAFVGLVVIANVATSTLGLVPIGFGLVVTAGTFAAGATLIVRDVVQDTAGRLAVLALIVIGAGVSWAAGAGTIALASGVAFAISELADMAVYTPLRSRSWNIAALASSAVGALVDSVIFLWLAGFGVTLQAVAGQWIVKVGLAVLTVGAVSGIALLRQPQPRSGG